MTDQPEIPIDLDDFSKLTPAEIVWRSLGQRQEPYPFCKTADCPYWRGYCSRDPACDN